MKTRADKNRRRFTLMVAGVLIAMAALHINASVVPADASIDAFWAKFKTAVIKGDKQTVSTMCQFPITMPYGVPSIRTKAQFMRRYRALFNDQADAAKCFAEARPEADASSKNKFSVACEDAAGNEVVIYWFVRTRGVWKLKSLDNVNE
jgi:hypothetical protein